MNNPNDAPLESLYDAVMAAIPCFIQLRTETDPATLMAIDAAFLAQSDDDNQRNNAATLLVIVA